VTAARNKGTAWETAIVRYLTGRGLPARRKAPSGRFDKADLEVEALPDFVIEAKNRRSRQREGEAVSEKSSLAEWVDEAVAEAANAGARVGVVWHHRNKVASPGGAYVTMTGDNFADMLLEIMELRVIARQLEAPHTSRKAVQDGQGQ
jgi:hypothetical protein